jgi:hypothetical protein
MSAMPDWWPAGCMGGKQEGRQRGKNDYHHNEFELHDKYTYHAVYIDTKHRIMYAE